MVLSSTNKEVPSPLWMELQAFICLFVPPPFAFCLYGFKRKHGCKIHWWGSLIPLRMEFYEPPPSTLLLHHQLPIHPLSLCEWNSTNLYPLPYIFVIGFPFIKHLEKKNSFKFHQRESLIRFAKWSSMNLYPLFHSSTIGFLFKWPRVKAWLQASSTRKTYLVCE